jgi:HEAT repeat protein
MRLPLFRMTISALLLAAAAMPLRAGEAASADAERIAGLVRKLGARYLDERQKAREALEQIGPAAEPDLRQALDDEDVRIRRGACELLGGLKSAAAAPRLVELLQDADSYVADAAREALVRIGLPAHEAIRRAREAGKIPAGLAEAITERPMKALVEETLDRCISKDLGWGFYKDQFKDLVALGPPATRVLLKLFTTPADDYEFTYTFGEAEEDPVSAARREYRKQIVVRLAGEALAEIKDPAVAPALKAFATRLEAAGADPLSGGVQGDRSQGELYIGAACALRRHGDPSFYERIRKVMMEAASAETGEDGAPRMKPGAAPTGKQVEALSELASLLVKNDDTAGAVWAYRQVIERAPKAETAGVPGVARPAPGGVRSLSGDSLALVRSAHYNLACALSLAGKKAEAVESLKQAAELGYRDADWIRRDRDLDAIREEPGYRETLLKLDRDRRRLEAMQRGEVPEDH